MASNRDGPWPERDAGLISHWSWRGDNGEVRSVATIGQLMGLTPNSISGRSHRLQKMGLIKGRGSPVGFSGLGVPKRRYQKPEEMFPPTPTQVLSKIMSSLAASVSSVRVATAEAKRAKRIGAQNSGMSRRAKSRPLTLPATSPIPVFIRAEPIPIPVKANPGETLFLSWPQIKTTALSDGKLLASMDELQSYNRWREKNGRAPVFVKRAAPDAHA